jgi:hypothetical protein
VHPDHKHIERIHRDKCFDSIRSARQAQNTVNKVINSVLELKIAPVSHFTALFDVVEQGHAADCAKMARKSVERKQFVEATGELS